MARTGIVSVHALQAGEFTLPERQFVAPLEDQNSRKTVPSLSFLIQHVCPQTGAKTRILYDLGIRRDLSLYGEGLRQHLATREPLSTESNVVESLRQGGLEPTDIDYVILSHVHWDHIGLPSDFPDSLFVVGNGSLELLDGTVTAKKGGHNHFDRDLFTQARVVELPTTNSDTENDTKAQKASIEDSSNGGLQLSGWRPFLNLPHTIDLFADGSLLIVDAPGHLPGHINLLCRVSDEPRYIYLAGDACHDRRLFTGEKHIAEWTDPQHSGTVCCIHADRTLAEKTLQRIKELTENIEAEVVLAHDDAWARDAHQHPGNGKPFASCPNLAAEDVDNVVQSSHKAFQTYRHVNPRTRAQLLLKWDQLIRAHRDDLATILTFETGKPLSEAYGELDYATGFTWWFAGEAERIRGDMSVPAAPNRRVFVVKQPIGVAVALVPWNFPVAMILRKVGAALAAGCTMIAKPSPETPLTTLALAHLAEQAGFEPGVFNVVTTSNTNTPALSEALCKHPLVSKVSFTGSTHVGSIIAKHCAEGLKKLTLELGGNCPFIVFADANQDQALNQLAALKWRHAGQACITANRIYVQDEIYDSFIERIRQHAQTITVGHGAEKNTTMGPLTTPRGIDKALAQINDAVNQGASIVHGGTKGDGPGYFLQPTIIRDMTSHMRITQEESFAPIAAIYRFKTEEEVTRLANDTSMGLASYVFTKSVDRIWRMFENLEAGMIGLNTGNSSAAESPFGGMKQSGYGKESGKDVAVAEYLVSKTGTLTLEDI